MGGFYPEAEGTELEQFPQSGVVYECKDIRGAEIDRAGE